MTTPKELADKAKQLADSLRYSERPGKAALALHATIDQLQAMAEAQQGSGEHGLTVDDMARVLQAAWAKAEPDHGVTRDPLGYWATFADMARAALAAATQAQPVIHAQFECVSDGITGSTSAPIKRVEQNDDGSFTVTIDHWPHHGIAGDQR